MHCTRRNGPHVISPGVVEKPVERVKTLYLQLCRKGRNPLRGVFEQPMERVRPAVQIRVHRRLMQLQFLAASAPLRETFPLSIEPVLSLPKGWIGEEAAGRRGEASPCFPWRPGDWPEGFIPCPAYGLPVQTF